MVDNMPAQPLLAKGLGDEQALIRPCDYGQACAPTQSSQPPGGRMAEQNRARPLFGTPLNFGKTIFSSMLKDLSDHQKNRASRRLVLYLG